MPWKELSHSYRAYMQISVDEQRHLVRMIRTTTSIPRQGPSELMTQFFIEMDKVLPPAMRATHRLYLDSRQAARMLDPTSEAELSGITKRFYGEFQRVAFILRTPIGLMQMRRIIRTLEIPGDAFLDEAEAMNYLVRSEPSG